MLLLEFVKTVLIIAGLVRLFLIALFAKLVTSYMKEFVWMNALSGFILILTEFTVFLVMKFVRAAQEIELINALCAMKKPIF
jgi:hypothetical protein